MSNPWDCLRGKRDGERGHNHSGKVDEDYSVEYHEEHHVHTAGLDQPQQAPSTNPLPPYPPTQEPRRVTNMGHDNGSDNGGGSHRGGMTGKLQQMGNDQAKLMGFLGNAVAAFVGRGLKEAADLAGPDAPGQILESAARILFENVRKRNVPQLRELADSLESELSNAIRVCEQENERLNLDAPDPFTLQASLLQLEGVARFLETGYVNYFQALQQRDPNLPLMVPSTSPSVYGAPAGIEPQPLSEDQRKKLAKHMREAITWVSQALTHLQTTISKEKKRTDGPQLGQSGQPGATNPMPTMTLGGNVNALALTNAISEMPMLAKKLNSDCARFRDELYRRRTGGLGGLFGR